MLAQTGHDNFNVLSFQIPAQRQKMHFGPARRQGINQMEHFHAEKFASG
jgi:hypothetical protein